VRECTVRTDPPTRYGGPTEVVERRGKLLLFDAGSGEVIAEVAPEAARKIRHREPSKMVFDGATLLSEAEAIDS
jgi:hypothetical protein